MKLNLKKAVIVLITSALTMGSALTATAQTTWQATHPRRTEVNGRLNNQRYRINEERHEGDISGRRARRLHNEDQAIRGEERAMARANHGHITRGERRMLNRQENGVSRQIGR